MGVEHNEYSRNSLRETEQEYWEALNNAERELEELEDRFMSCEDDKESEKIEKRMEYLEGRIDLYKVEITKARMWLNQ